MKISDDTRVRLLLTRERLLEHLPEYAGKVICLDQEQRLIADQEENSPKSLTWPESMAYVIYTSGSTGKPKGVVGSHRGVVNYLNYIANTYNINSADVVLQLPSLSFDASIRDLIGSLTVGARVVIVNNREAKEPAALLSLIRAHEITCLLSVVPTMLNGLIEAANGSDLPYDYTYNYTYDSIRLILVSGEVLQLSICQKARVVFSEGSLIVNQYGATECTMTSTYYPLHTTNGDRDIVSIGKPIPNYLVYILDTNLKQVTGGVRGELYIGGVGLTFGYLNRPEITAGKFIPNPFGNEPGTRLYETGDLACCQSDGNLRFLGRIDNQVKIRGIRVELGEIESVLLRHGNIKECAVVIRNVRRAQRNLIAKESAQTTNIDDGDHKRLVAYIVYRNGTTSPELRNFLEKELPSYMIPAQFVQLEALPLNSNGKVDLKALPEPDTLRPDLQEAFVAPGDSVESLIAGIWGDVLGIDHVGVNDSFFELGGDSLITMQVLNRLRRITNQNLSFQDLFENQTVARLARLVQKTGQKSSISILPTKARKKERYYPLSLAQQGIWFLWKMEPDNPYYTAQGIVHLYGALNIPVFRSAWQALLERHEILRVRFGIEGGKPVQMFEDCKEIDLRVTDLTGLPEVEGNCAIRRIAREEIEHPFDLESAPPFAISIVQAFR